MIDINRHLPGGARFSAGSIDALRDQRIATRTLDQELRAISLQLYTSSDDAMFALATL